MKGYTKKPCHGCGNIPHHYGGREVDKVCGDCLKLLKDARDIKEALARNSSDTEAYILPWAPHAMGYIAHCEFQGANDAFRKHIYSLIKFLAVPDPDAWTGKLENVVTGTQGGGREDVGRLVPAVRDSLYGMYQAAIQIAEEAYKNGKRDGRNLIAGLAKGEISIETYNKATIGEPKQ